MTFSLCHASARLTPSKQFYWWDTAKKWLDRAYYPDDVEHILCLDAGAHLPAWPSWPVFKNSQIVTNTATRPGAAEPWNVASMAANGDVLISVADDWYPCDKWDVELLKRIPDVNGEHCVWVRTGPEQSLIYFNIVTRPYFDRLIREHGYAGFFHPGYIGMCADNDFTVLTQLLNRKQRGLLIDARDELTFQHFHPEYRTAQMDDVYRNQHRTEAYNVGAALFEKRRANGFKD
jgi:hypothetical protein